MRAPRPAAVALALCLGVAAGPPAAWALGRPSDSIGARPSPAVGTPAPVPANVAGDGAVRTQPAPARAVPRPGQVPARVRMPALGIDAKVVPVGVGRDRAMALPDDARRAGWYRFGPRPRDGVGSVVVAAHVDSRVQGRGAFYPLRAAKPGDRVEVVTRDGSVTSYRVVAREMLSKRALPLEELFRRDGREVLTLITCGGRYLREAGGYQDNVVVTALPVRAGR